MAEIWRDVVVRGPHSSLAGAWGGSGIGAETVSEVAAEFYSSADRGRGVGNVTAVTYREPVVTVV